MRSALETPRLRGFDRFVTVLFQEDVSHSGQSAPAGTTQRRCELVCAGGTIIVVDEARVSSQEDQQI